MPERTRGFALVVRDETYPATIGRFAEKIGKVEMPVAGGSFGARIPNSSAVLDATVSKDKPFYQNVFAIVDDTKFEGRKVWSILTVASPTVFSGYSINKDQFSAILYENRKKGRDTVLKTLGYIALTYLLVTAVLAKSLGSSAHRRAGRETLVCLLTATQIGKDTAYSLHNKHYRTFACRPKIVMSAFPQAIARLRRKTGCIITSAQTMRHSREGAIQGPTQPDNRFVRAFNRFHRRLGTGTQLGDRRVAVAKAFAGETLIAICKSLAAIVTGSSSLLAEAVHSWVSLVSDCFRTNAYLVAARPADAAHPLGYGRESYVWGLFGSAGTFLFGAQFGIWHGIEKWHTKEPVFGYTFGYLVLGCAFAAQAVSFMQALRFVRRKAVTRGLGVVGHLLTTSDTLLRAVVTEDLLALLGLAIAALSLALHQLTGRAEFDGAGSIAIGTLMGIVGLYLIDMNRRFLAGVPLPPDLRAKVIASFRQTPEVQRVTALFAEYIGPERILISARVELAGNHDQADLARMLRRLERKLMAHPHVGRATLSLSAPEEPDLE